MKKITLTLFSILFLSNLFATPFKRQVTLKIKNITKNTIDVTQIYFDQGTFTLFNPIITSPPEDLPKQIDSSKPQIYSFTSDNVSCYSNFYGTFDSTTNIRLGTYFPDSSLYRIELEYLANFDPLSMIILEDRYTGKFTDLRVSTYTINITSKQTFEDRFYIHFHYPPIIALTNSDCDDMNGKISINQDTSITWTNIQLLDSNLFFINIFNNVKGNLQFSNLSSGKYTLVLVYGTNNIIKSINLKTNKVLAKISASKTRASIGETVNFYSQCMNASNYTWDFGDGSIITGVANPKNYWFQAGNYKVKLECTNSFGCKFVDSLNIEIGNFSSVSNQSENTKTYIENKTLIIESELRSNYTIFSINGQTIKRGNLDKEHTHIDLLDLASGIYFIKLGDFSISKVWVN